MNNKITHTSYITILNEKDDKHIIMDKLRELGNVV